MRPASGIRFVRKETESPMPQGGAGRMKLCRARL
jgi:hypothetical protein